ncbi:MAG: oxygen-dependent coproporphyrinogen oxidase [Flavobacteriales bacterium]
MLSKEAIATEFQNIQKEICEGLEACDGAATFVNDDWQHATGGGGSSRLITHGNVFEKGGVNFSAVQGTMPSFMKEKVSSDATTFFATGVSIVMHPQSPMVPIIHMNIRYFETDAGDAWFGGGIDLTPVYVDKEQATQFHRTLKQVCDMYLEGSYAQFKQQADDYFFIKHRNETRGIGGIFFDYLRHNTTVPFENTFQFVCDVGRSFLAAYTPIVDVNRNLHYGEKQKQWQLLRRGRYVEFNLVYDRGTRFGLETGGRTESILMSLPEQASWLYNHKVAADSDEAATLGFLKKGFNWL